MSAQLIRTALSIGRKYGTGGSDWTPITAISGTITTVPILSVGNLITLSVLETAWARSVQALPQVGIYKADWWGIGPVGLAIEAGVVLLSAADPSLAFLVDGQADTSQGMAIYPLKKVDPPAVATVGTQASYQAGLRIGAW